MSRSAGSKTTSEPPGATSSSASSSRAARRASASGPGKSSFTTCPIVTRSKRRAAGELRERSAARRVPLARRDGLARGRRERSRGGERARRTVGSDHLGGPGVERRERDGRGAAAEVEHGARPARQLGEDAARLEVGDGPVEEQVRAEEAAFVHVARAGELSLAREPPRQPGDRRARPRAARPAPSTSPAPPRGRARRLAARSAARARRGEARRATPRRSRPSRHTRTRCGIQRARSSAAVRGTGRAF